MAPREARVVRIFVAGTSSLAVLLGVTLGLATLQANRIADASIRAALAELQRGVQALLAGRTATLAGQIKQATSGDVVFFALDTLDHPHVVGTTLPRDQVGPALGADTALRRNARDSGAVEVSAVVGEEHLIGLVLAVACVVRSLRTRDTPGPPNSRPAADP